MKLAISLATRGRAELLLSTLTQTLNNMRLPDTVLLVAADADDAPTIAAVQMMAASDRRVLLSIAPREDTVAAKWNRVLTAVDADVYLPMCDDGPQITQGFDVLILEAAAIFPDGIGVVTNHLENATFPGIQGVTRRLAALMGYIYPEHFPYWFVDHWLLDITRLIDRDAFADVRLDCSSNRPPTAEMREPAFWATFYDACYLLRRRLAHRIILLEEFASPAWQKELLLRHHPKIEYYSKWVNDLVRSNGALADYAAKNPPDDRYRRLKSQARSMLKSLIPELEDAARSKAA